MLVSFFDAYQKVLESDIKKLGSERIIFSNALNRILAEDIYAKEDVPACALSSMDGYAFCIKDLEQLKTTGLKILGSNPAGNMPDPLPRGHALKTFTGAVMPEGSDSVVIIEDVEVEDNLLKLKNDAMSPYENQWIRQKGDNYKKGELLLPKGSKITPFEIALLAELNQVFIQVYQRPKIGILASGDELVEVGEMKDNIAQVRSTNPHLLSAMIEQMGAIAVVKEKVQDEFKEDGLSPLERSFLELLDECDVILTTGGMSKGDFDFTQQVIKKYANTVFHGINIKPGKPTLFAISKDAKKPILGLPGNPNATGVIFFLFSKAIMANLLNQKIYPKKLLAKLTCNLAKTDSRLELRACSLSINNGLYEINQDMKKTNASAIINNLCQNTALAILPDGIREFYPGDMLEIILLYNEG